MPETKLFFDISMLRFTMHTNIRTRVFFSMIFFISANLGKGSCIIGESTPTQTKQANCEGDLALDSETGICPGCACKPGYYGQKCDNECPQGTYGPQCKYLCRCETPEICDKASGHCRMEHCQDGWFSGFNCNRKKCSTLKPSFEQDDTSCSQFYICFPNSPFGFTASCPEGLHWIPDTANCTHPQKVRCNTEQEYKPMDAVSPATFRSFQRYMKEILNASVCTAQMDNVPVQYEACPASLWKLHPMDFNPRLNYEREHLAYRSHDEPIASSLYRFYKDRKFGIYRHDPNHCAFFHECIYSENEASILLHTTWGMCPGGSVFNYNWVTCVTPTDFAEGMHGSTMPEVEKAEMCNIALLSVDNVADRSALLQEHSEAIYQNLNQYLSANT